MKFPVITCILFLGLLVFMPFALAEVDSANISESQVSNSSLEQNIVAVSLSEEEKYEVLSLIVSKHYDRINLAVMMFGILTTIVLMIFIAAVTIGITVVITIASVIVWYAFQRELTNIESKLKEGVDVEVQRQVGKQVRSNNKSNDSEEDELLSDDINRIATDIASNIRLKNAQGRTFGEDVKK